MTKRADVKSRTVHIGTIEISADPDDVLVAYGLGSCVTVCLYDRVARVGGMLHALLPEAANNKRVDHPAKFVDRGMAVLLEELGSQGAKHARLTVQLCGGASLLSWPEFDGLLNIGERNIQAAQNAIRKAGLRIHARDTGGTLGRTVRLYIATGQVTVRTLECAEHVIDSSGEN
ncbi:MAG: chemotaxis protein CheD [Anaerolineae bacterium]|nr:chemotaxis protein CheD [Anaerolineae bacterium]